MNCDLIVCLYVHVFFYSVPIFQFFYSMDNCEQCRELYNDICVKCEADPVVYRRFLTMNYDAPKYALETPLCVLVCITLIAFACLYSWSLIVMYECGRCMHTQTKCYTQMYFAIDMTFAIIVQITVYLMILSSCRGYQVHSRHIKR